MTPESAPSAVTIVALFALAVLAVILLIGGLLRHIWAQSEQRSIEKMRQARECLLDPPGPVAPSHEIVEGTRGVVQRVTAARVLYIVARDQPELFAFLRQDFAREAAEGVIEILMNRRQGVQSRDADGRDPHCNGGVSRDLRELGFAFVRQQAHFFNRPPGGR